MLATPWNFSKGEPDMNQSAWFNVDGGKQVSYVTLLPEVLAASSLGPETTSGPFSKFKMRLTELQD